MTASIIIVTYNSSRDIRPCLDSIYATAGSLDVEVLVVDNASPDDTVAIVRDEYPMVRLIANEENTGFPYANNQGMQAASGLLFILLNPDTVVHEGSLSGIVSFMESTPDCGVAGPVLVDQHGTETPDLHEPTLRRNFLSMTPFGSHDLDRVAPCEVGYISGACLCIRREVTDRIGMLDNRFFWFEDMEFCVRARRHGYMVCRIDGVFVTHLVGQSAKTNIGLKQYVRHASFLGFVNEHYPLGKRAGLTGLLAIEVSLMMVKSWLVFALRRDQFHWNKARGLLEVLKDFPVLSRPAHWQNHQGMQEVMTRKSFLVPRRSSSADT